MKNAYRIFVGEPDRKRPLGGSKRRWKIILEWILGKYGGKMWTGCIWLRIETRGRLL